MPATSPPFLLLFSLLLLSSSTLSDSYFFSNYQTLVSLSHSLISRVANLRASRGDVGGAERARALARNLERGLGLGFYKFAWNLGWDYVKNYAGRDTESFETLGGVVSELNELLEAFGELNRNISEAERVSWIGRHYHRALRVSKSIFSRLLGVFRESGPLQEVVTMLQKEVVDGDLLRDCLEVGGGDVKGLIQVLKDIALQYTSASRNTEL